MAQSTNRTKHIRSAMGLTLALTMLVATSPPGPKTVYSSDDLPERFDTGAGDTGAAEEACETDLGSLAGEVLRALPWEENEYPAANALVYAQSGTEGEAAIQILTNTDGEFTADLPADTYSVWATDSEGCISNRSPMELSACGTATLVLRLTDCLDGGG